MTSGRRRADGGGPSTPPSTPGDAPGPSRRTSPAGGEHPDRLVTLIGKPGCHLCDDARAVVEAVCADLGVRWEERDITREPGLHEEYWEQIPVVLIDGRQHDFWRIREDRLRAALGAPGR
ncbi:glutaredoxin family protein [Streptomyces alkaliphilus]|uniref:Glutaredoxin family protein n=1 Tax=Streptomyces alkaliphilus TaxID=1472722 RepID=A0A7W3TFZ1_9ACTN|nr:glutaredoxin family protein [Streptomyces alkaliphilus]